MGYRYENNLDAENERKYLASLTPIKRLLYKLSYWAVMLVGGLFAFWAAIGWWLVKLI